MATYTFRPPTVDEGPAGGHRLFYFYKLKRGITVVKDGGTWSTLRYSVDEDLNDYDVVYRGGYNHTVDEATKAELIAASIGVTEDNFTVQ
jgi:hypothetical protein